MIGETVGNYRLLELLGQGGMGAVYLAEHTTLGRRAAIKVLLPARAASPELVERFFQEARMAAQLEHPSLVDIYDFGTAGPHAFIVMELLAGETLAARFARERTLPLLHALTIGRQVANALAATHAKGIMHRDLKPENLFLVPDQETSLGFRVKVVDFGLAKLYGGGGLTSATQTGHLLGTPLYMSPEQARGVKDIDYRTDIYSLGVLLYELATGRVPFLCETSGDLIVAHIQQVPDPPSHHASIPRELDALIVRCLAKPREERPQSMVEVVHALEALLGGRAAAMTPMPFAIAPPPPTPQTATTLGHVTGEMAALQRPRGRRIALVITGVAIAAGIVIGVLVAGGDATPAPTAVAVIGPDLDAPPPPVPVDAAVEVVAVPVDAPAIDASVAEPRQLPREPVVHRPKGRPKPKTKEKDKARVQQRVKDGSVDPFSSDKRKKQKAGT